MDRSGTGVYRLHLFRGFAIGWEPRLIPTSLFRIDRYPEQYPFPAWAVVVLWFHFGKADRENWTHF